MDYPVATYEAAIPMTTSGTTKTIIIVVAFSILVAIGIALGVGLGVGLSRHNDGSSSSSSPSILSAPIVTCTYSGSATCGCAATKGSFLSAKIVQGYTSVANSWPWIVALYINNNQVFCGGFLVTYQHVVTAAHCVNGITGQIVAYAGIQTLSARNSGQARVVSTFIVHPDYSASAATSDIAILKLTTPFNETTTVGKCCLTSDTSLPILDEHGVIAGWGYPSSSSTSVSDELLQGVIEVLSDSVCSSSSANSIRFCAGYDGTDTCFGDSGSPFMTSVNNSWTCTGVVSAGRGCGTGTLYTRVSAFQSWINTYISS